jgi:hypothetical protein
MASAYTRVGTVDLVLVLVLVLVFASRQARWHRLAAQSPSL